MITFYLVSLIIAPQLWIAPFIGMRVDFILYPIWLVVIYFKGKHNRLWAFQSHDFFFLSMIGWITISSSINQSNELTNNIIINYIKWFLLFRLVIASIEDFSQMKRVIFIMLVLSYVLVFESIQHKLSFDGIGWAGQPLGWADDEVLKTTGSGRTKWINIFDGPGVFCVIFTIALPFMLQYFDKHYSFLKKILSGIIIVPLLMAIYFTGSRGGILASIVILFFYLLIRQKISFTKIIIATLFAFSILVIAPTHLTSTRDSHNSAQNRVDMWAQGLEMAKFNPFFGIGKGNYQRYTGSLIAHNSAIEILGETGFPGFFLWISLIFLSFKSLFLFWKSTSDSPEKQSLAKALGICLLGYIAASMFVTLEYETFYFLLALAAILGKMSGVSVHFTIENFFAISFGILVLVLSFKVLVMIY